MKIQPTNRFSLARKSRALLAATLAAGALAANLSRAHADTWTWNGGGASVGNFNWSDTANWTHAGGATSPASSTDTIVSFAGSTGLPVNQDIANPMLLNSLNFQSGTAVFQLSGNALDFTTNAGVTPTIVQNSASGDLIINPITLNNNTTMSGSGTGGLIFLGTISGAGSLTATSGGNLTLLGNNNYAGGTTINGGTVVIGSSSSLGSGNLTFTSGNLIAGNVTLTTNFTTNNSGAMGFQANAGTTFVINPTSALFGSMNFGSATNTGTINFEPANFNWFGGTINVLGGTLLDGADSLSQTLSAYTVNIASGATLNLNGFSATINNLTGSGNLATGTDATQNVTLTSANFSGIISGASSLVTTGTVILSGPNTYTGGSILNGGNVGAGNNAALGTQAVIVTGNTSLYAVGSTITLANQIFFSTPKFLSVINNPGGVQNLILSGNISGNGGIIMSGTGSLKLSGNNSYSGNTTLNSGELIINNNNSLGSGTLNLIGGIVTASADTTLNGNYTDQSATSPITFRAVAATTLTLGGTMHFGTQTVNFGGVGFTGTVNFSPGTDTGTNSIFNVNSGTLLDGDGQLASFLASANLTVASGAKLDLNGDTVTIKNLLGAGNVATGTSAAEHLTLRTANFSGNISGSGQLFTASNSTTVILSGASTYTGGSTLAGGTLGFGNNAALSTGNISLTANTSLYAAAADRILANPISLASTKTLTITDDPNGAHNLILSGNITGAGGLIMNATGSLTLSGGGNNYSGNTTINSGTVVLAAAQSLGTGTVFFNGGTITSSGNRTVNNIDDTNATSPITFLAPTGTTLTIGGTFNTGTKDINFGNATNTGTISFQPGGGVFSFATNYNVNGGTLLDSAGALGSVLSTEYVTIASGATVDFNSNNGGFGDLLGSGTVKTGTNANETLTVTFAEFSGNITGSGKLVTQSGGNITLSGASNYSGGSTFAGGLIHAGNDAAFGSFPITVTSTTGLFLSAANRTLNNVISINAGQALLLQNDPASAFNLTLNGSISGAGTLAQTGNGTLTLGGLLTVNTLNIGNSTLASKVVLQTASFPANKISTLSLFSTSTLDLTTTLLIVEDTAPSRTSDLAQLKTQVASSSIFSSTAAAFNSAAGKTVKVVALSDNAIRIATFPTGSTNFGGINNADSNSILITVAYKGDANLDGVVDIQDLTDVANHWQQPVTDWSQGDFDNSNFVDISDLTAIANNWQAGTGGGSSGAGSSESFSQALASLPSFGTPATSTPEPTSLALLGLGTLLLTKRRIK